MSRLRVHQPNRFEVNPDKMALDSRYEEIMMEFRRTTIRKGSSDPIAEKVFPITKQPISFVDRPDFNNEPIKPKPDEAVDDRTAAEMDRYSFLRRRLKYEFMTPEDFGANESVTVFDIIDAFNEVTSTHGFPHIKFARGF